MPLKNRILLIAGNYYPEPTGIGRFNNEMIDWLADNGFDCTVITTYPYYPHWQVQPPYSKKRWWYKKEIKQTSQKNNITVYRCPHFIPSNITGKTRVISDFTFFIAVFFRLLFMLGKKFDYVMNVSPPVAPGLLAVWYKKIKKARFLYHVQDLQAEAARELNIIKSKGFIDFILKIENYIMGEADVISAVSTGMVDKMQQKTNKTVILFPNWTNTNNFYPLKGKHRLKEEYGFSASDKVILYSGAIGEKQGLEIILHVARYFSKKQHYKFVVCGTGPYKTKLEKTAQAQKLKNIFFLPLQPEESLNKFLNMADMHLIAQKAGITDLMMPSKLTNILAVGGLALVTANGNSALYNMVKNNCIAIHAKPENQQHILNAIEAGLTSDHTHIKANARVYAEKYLSAETVLAEYKNIAFNL